MKTLKTVTDRFSLVDSIRRHTPQNERNYLLKSVRATLTDPRVKEHIALGEMFGYYGHGRRALQYAKNGRLTLDEVSVVMVDGKPVTLTNIPSNRTLQVDIDDNGIVTHTQEILDTDPGRIVQGMESSNAGGWSWATSGDDSSWRSVVTGFYGFDYVTTPNYISLDRKSLMLESNGDRTAAMLTALREAGYSENTATDLCHHFETMRKDQAMFEAVDRTSFLESQLWALQGQVQEMKERISNHNAMLESSGDLAVKRRRVVRETLDKLPLFISKDQRQALLRMESEEDAQVFAAMLEAVAGQAAAGLPVGGQQPHQPAPAKRNSEATDEDILWLQPKKR